VGRQEGLQACGLYPVGLYPVALYRVGLYRVALYRASRFSSVHVHKGHRELVRLVRRCAQASGVRCIPHVPPRLGRVRLASVPGFRRRDQSVQAVVRGGPRADRDNVTFHAE